jgi:hypothetical protein
MVKYAVSKLQQNHCPGSTGHAPNAEFIIPYLGPHPKLSFPPAAGRNRGLDRKAPTSGPGAGLAKVEAQLPYVGRCPGRPLEDRAAIARAFVAKVAYGLPTTRMLLDRLKSDPKLRRLCGWEQRGEVPSESTFSRAFAEFAHSHFAGRVHAALIQRQLGDQLIGHIPRDSTAILAREKPAKKKATPEVEPPKPRGRPKKGGVRVKAPTRLERQAAGQPLTGMLADLPQACDVGTKRNSKGYKTGWTGYKLHIDAADGGIPISCVLTSASVHDTY